MGDPTKMEPRYDTGETAQEAVDRMASPGNPRVDGGAKGQTMVPRAPAPQNLHPSAKGVYGAPVGKPILTGGR